MRSVRNGSFFSPSDLRRVTKGDTIETREWQPSCPKSTPSTPRSSGSSTPRFVDVIAGEQHRRPGVRAGGVPVDAQAEDHRPADRVRDAPARLV